MARADRVLSKGRLAVYRHPLAVRLTHWLNAVALLVLLTSGLQIFNAHPALYLGAASDFARPVMAMTATEAPDGRIVAGVTRLGGRAFDTTGLFGASRVGGELVPRGFPAWLTLPPGQDLAAARLWHFFFAWVLALSGAAYVVHGLASGRLRRELLPTGPDLRHIGASLAEHARLRFPTGEAARRYNVLQKLSYLLVLFVLLPLMVLTGMTLSPGLNTALPWLLDLFGGRQTARSLHFAIAASLVLFVLVHLIMVVAAGPLNELRSMITGRYVIRPETPPP